LRVRPYAGPDDLRRMQALVTRAWQLRGPKVERHIGDVAWGRFQHVGREPEWRTLLWEEEANGEVVAWAWLFRPRTLDFQLHPERTELLAAVLDWFEAEAEGDEPLVTSALREDEAAVAELERRGYEAVRDEPWFAYLVRDLSDAPAEPRVPDGFRLRSVRGDEDVAARVAVHRAAFHPSRVTVESYRNVRRAYPYRADLDCVVEAPDGSLASYCLVWFDEAIGVGELEPVGTHPDHQRCGLASAVCRFALRRLAALGATTAIVYARGDDTYPAPKRLYESIGFREHTRSLEFRKPRT
jgi:ribosomal protein S18 acetylase RimI-like enzyme